MVKKKSSSDWVTATREFTTSKKLKKRKIDSSPIKLAKHATNTRRWEPNVGGGKSVSESNPKPKFVVSDVADPVRKKRKAKPKDPKRGLKAGEMRGTTSQRKKAQASIGAARVARRRTKFLAEN